MHGDADEAPGVMPGDLVVVVQVKPHDIFTRKGADLFIEKSISLLEALGGFCFHAKTLDGTQVQVASAPGEIVCDGTKKVLKSFGMPFHGE